MSDDTNTESSGSGRQTLTGTNTDRGAGDRDLTASEIEAIQMRNLLAANLGQQYGGDRDLYKTFGWQKQPDIEDFYAMYLRHPYAQAIVDTPVETTWRGAPEIDDEEETDAEEQTPFEAGVQRLTNDHRVWHYAKRADRLAGIGQFGVLVIGFDDGEDLSAPVNASVLSSLSGDSQSPILWLRPFSQLSVDDMKVGGPDSPRWGKPTHYRLDLGDENDALADDGPDRTIWVHHQRVIHVPAQELLDDEIRSRSRLEAPYNPLYDIEKTLGSAAELAYRSADRGLHINVDPEYRLEDGGKRLDEEVQKFVHDLQPFIRTEGADIEELGGADIDPSPIIASEIEAISAVTRIPQSVLKGNETGERATTQDLKEFYGTITERREQFVTPTLVRELLDRLRRFGVLDEPTGGDYDVDWPPLAEQSAKDISEVQLNRAKILKHIQTLVPGLTSEGAVQWVEDGEFPDMAPQPAAVQDGDLPPLNESDPQVQAYFDAAFPATADD
ncbi:anti-CBASS protein Acb1 family protein [Halomarina litorea]|uniref:anti-CBASS protein Acb1 family protein n=1 Tax=Halomarina litorea TaxID=2961595 RepID=UPI0020C28E99|nr:anti-CBASS Acb1 family protein [Halomarina sp. BCD28]